MLRPVRICVVLGALLRLPETVEALAPSFISSKNRRRGLISFFSTSQQKEQLDTASASTDEDNVVDRSTLTLLEHVNLNVPNHAYIVPFYIELLGLGLDPRKAENVVAGSKTVWANCGASQFHLPYGEQPQVVPGHIGLIYDNLQPLQDRIAKEAQKSPEQQCFASYEITKDHVKLVDHYGNVFLCQEQTSTIDPTLVQPLVSTKDTEQFGNVATKYGVDSETECRGVSHVEFHCPVGTADRIAEFYDSVLDATTSVFEDNGIKNAIIGFGNISQQGRAAQSLLFRETTDDIPEYDGHHVAMYVGESAADFEQAFRNAETAGVVWVNPRFSDKATTLQGAKNYKQFRFKDILDLKTGHKILELEHEMRSVEHKFWPGKKD